MKRSVGCVLIAIGLWLLQSDALSPAKAGHYERQNDAGAPNELRWGGDAEGGSPFVEADPSDPTRVVGFEVEIARLLAEGLGRQPRFIQVGFTTTRCRSRARRLRRRPERNRRQPRTSIPPCGHDSLLSVSRGLDRSRRGRCHVPRAGRSARTTRRHARRNTRLRPPRRGPVTIRRRAGRLRGRCASVHRLGSGPGGRGPARLRPRRARSPPEPRAHESTD